MRIALCLLVVAAVLAPAATAGGDFVDLAVHGPQVWFVGSFGVRELDAKTGRTIASPQLQGAAIPISVTVAGGAAWVASIENGYVSPKLTRIDLRTGAHHVIWRRSVPEYVAAGAGGVYALLNNTQVVLFATNGRLVRTWNVPGAGRMAADATGCWVSANRRLVHIDSRRHVHVIEGPAFGDLATGDGAVWVGLRHEVLRVDERSGRIRTLHTGRLALGGFQHDLAFGDGALWTRDTLTPSLQRRDPETGRLERAAPLPDLPDAVVPTPTGVWIGIALSHQVLRFDPVTLRRTLAVAVD